MLVTSLLILAAVVALAGVAVAVLAFAMRRPALAARLMRIGVMRRIFAKVAAAGLRQQRAKLERQPEGKGAAPLSDLEVMLAGQEGPQAEQAKAMLARMNPRQRQQLSRMTLGADGIGSLMEAAATAPAATADEETDALEALGRAERRRVQSLAGSSSPRDAQRAKEIAKRRQKRKAARKR